MTRGEILQRHKELFISYYDAAASHTTNPKEFIEKLSHADVAALLVLLKILGEVEYLVTPLLERIAIKNDFDDKSYYEMQGIVDEDSTMAENR